MTDINVTVTTPTTITATATDPNTVAVAVSAASTVTVTALVGNVGDMTKAVYDTDNNGVVDNSSALGGVPAGFYALQTDLHARQHSIISTSDHTSTATSGQMLKADANGLPVNATNTDAQVSAAVTASHAAVTVADTTSIDMTLTGQQVSAAAIFGTSAGVVAEGNHTHYSYYPLQWSQAGGWSVLANTTYYLGGKLVQDGNPARARLYFPVAGTIIAADFNSYVGTTLASAETSSVWIRINNTTDTLISDAIVLNNAGRYERFVNSSLSIAVTTSDYFEIKWTTPAWSTTPTNTRQYGIITVRV